jgi:hypothetical protein
VRVLRVVLPGFIALEDKSKKKPPDPKGPKKRAALLEQLKR